MQADGRANTCRRRSMVHRDRIRGRRLQRSVCGPTCHTSIWTTGGGARVEPTVDVISDEHTSQTNLIPPSVPRVPVFFLMTPILPLYRVQRAAVKAKAVATRGSVVTVRQRRCGYARRKCVCKGPTVQLVQEWELQRAETSTIVSVSRRAIVFAVDGDERCCGGRRKSQPRRYAVGGGLKKTGSRIPRASSSAAARNSRQERIAQARIHSCGDEECAD